MKMALFGFINKFFSSKKETAVISIDDVGSWLSQKTSERIQAHDDNVDSKIEELKRVISSTREKLNVLENAQLRNENIQEKLKNFMVGNRSNYIKQVTIFLDGIIIPENRSDMGAFVESVNLSLDSLSKSATKSFYILQEFFANETGKVAEELKRIDSCLKDIKSSLDSSDLHFIDEVGRTVAAIQKELGRKKSLSSEIEDARKKVSELESEIFARQKELAHIENTSEYLNVNSLKNTLSANEENLKRLDFEATQLFSPLTRAFRKYEKLSPSNADLVARYNDPMNGMLFDTQLRILEILREIRVAILKHDIELKDNDRMIKKINEITKERLDGLKMSYFHLKEKSRQIEYEIKNSAIIFDHNDIAAAIRNSGSLLEKARAELDNKVHDLSIISVENNLKDLSDKIEEYTDVKVTITT